eukprot:SM000008S22294  [mRNA]  locus=s8:887428:889666:+ [translate_table: standard]
MAPPRVEEIGANKSFSGHVRRFQHDSAVLGCAMKFSVYFPPAADSRSVPVVYFLSGLTCTDENFLQKAGAQRAAMERGVAIVSPDTSPRGLNVEGEADSWDFGVGAGFYLNATEEKWRQWRMYDYITEELPELLASNFSQQLDTSKSSILGHSMGGHGALTIFLRNSTKYKAVSALAPIANPCQCPWGEKAFTGYLGDDKSNWKQYDATELVKDYSGPSCEILIDQGTEDKFFKEKQLLPETFSATAAKGGRVKVNLRLQEGYDHSYYFISTFIADHINLHADILSS